MKLSTISALAAVPALILGAMVPTAGAFAEPPASSTAVEPSAGDTVQSISLTTFGVASGVPSLNLVGGLWEGEEYRTVVNPNELVKTNADGSFTTTVVKELPAGTWEYQAWASLGTLPLKPDEFGCDIRNSSGDVLSHTVISDSHLYRVSCVFTIE